MNETICTAGFARLDITPPLGVPMIGAGPRTVKGVLDPLYVCYVAVSDGSAKAENVQDLNDRYPRGARFSKCAVSERFTVEISDRSGAAAFWQRYRAGIED